SPRGRIAHRDRAVARHRERTEERERGRRFAQKSNPRGVASMVRVEAAAYFSESCARKSPSLEPDPQAYCSGSFFSRRVSRTSYSNGKRRSMSSAASAQESSKP